MAEIPEGLTEVFLKYASVGFIRKVLDALKAKELIECQEIPDQELLAIINDIMEADKPKPEAPKVEKPKVKVITTESKIEDAIAYCENNGIKLTVRNIAKYAGVSHSTVVRHNQK